MKVREIMTDNVATAAPDSTLSEIANLMKSEDTGAIPILDGDELAGIITDRDIVIRCVANGTHPADCTAEDILSADLEAVEPDADVEEAAALMAQKQIRRLPVVEDGKLVGMVSLGDLAVKHDGDIGGETLDGVSRGVKRSPGTQKNRATARPSARSKPSAGNRATQGISNRSADEELRRQNRVIPIRPEATTLNRSQKRKRRKAS